MKLKYKKMYGKTYVRINPYFDNGFIDSELLLFGLFELKL